MNYPLIGLSFLITIFFQVSFLYGDILDVDQVYYNKNDRIEIVFCDKNGWCQVKGTNYFLKKHRLKEVLSSGSSSIYEVKSSGNTYIYLNNQSIKENSMLWGYVSQKILTYPKKIIFDFKSNFTRIDIIKSYLTRRINNDKPVFSKYVAKEEQEIPSVKLKKINQMVLDKEEIDIIADNGEEIKNSTRGYHDKKKEVTFDENIEKGVKKTASKDENRQKVQKTQIIIDDEVQNNTPKQINQMVVKDQKRESKKVITTVQSRFTSLFDFTKEGKVSFLGALGLSQIGVDSSVSDAELSSSALDNSGLFYTLGLGRIYKINNKNIFATVNLLKTSLDTLEITNFFLSGNYIFDNKRYRPYLGVLLGYSTLKWGNSPVLNTISSNLTANSLLYGFQAGVSKKVKENLSIFLQHQLMFLNASLDVNNEESIKYKSQNNFLVGVKYEF